MSGDYISVLSVVTVSAMCSGVDCMSGDYISVLSVVTVSAMCSIPTGVITVSVQHIVYYNIILVWIYVIFNTKVLVSQLIETRLILKLLILRFTWVAAANAYGLSMILISKIEKYKYCFSNKFCKLSMQNNTLKHLRKFFYKKMCFVCNILPIIEKKIQNEPNKKQEPKFVLFIIFYPSLKIPKWA